MQTYSIKEIQLLVKDAPVVPVEILPFVGVPYRCSKDVYEAFKGLAQMPTEAFVMLHLDAGYKVVGMTTVSIGSMTSGLVHPREVFRAAIVSMTARLIFIHNHPCGDPTPSQEDLDITRRLFAIGKLIGIACVDHIIIGHGDYFSFADEGLIEPRGRNHE